MQTVGLPEQVLQGDVHPTQLPPTKYLEASRQDKQKERDWHSKQGLMQGWHLLVVLS